jgi:TRAP transporter 4TM/12TM fusion protein
VTAAVSDIGTLKYGSIGKLVTSAIAIGLALFQIYHAIFGIWEAYLTRVIYLTVVLMLIFLIYPVSKRYNWRVFLAIDMVFVAFTIVIGIYVVFNYKALLLRAGAAYTIDIIFGGILVLLVLEAVRRTVGPPMVVITVALILYTSYGIFFPGPLKHGGIPVSMLIEYSFLTTEGIFGLPLGTAVTTIFIFVIMATFLSKTGLADFFGDLANGLLGHTRGGPAKVAVLSSALVGSITGSAAANVATTGSFTIPTMKKTGYDANTAGAIEAAASTGSQVMPPVMAAAGFLVAAMVGVPYITVAICALFPAILYFLSVGAGVHFLAVKQDLQGLSKDRLPNAGAVFRERWYLVSPLVVVVILLMKGYSPMMSGTWAVVVTLLVSMIKRDSRINLKKLLNMLDQSTRNVLELFITCACAGMIVSTTLMSGLAMKIPYLISYVAGENLFLSLLMGGIGVLLLGVGMTTTAVYIIGAVMVAPAIIPLGAPVLATHLFILYLGVMANVTPPVAIASYTAASLSGGSLWSTSIVGFKLALAGFLIPFVFVYNTALLMQGTVLSVIWVVATTGLGSVALAAAIQGYSWRRLGVLERLIVAVGAICLVNTNVAMDIVGLVVLLGVFMADYTPKIIMTYLKNKGSKS